MDNEYDINDNGALEETTGMTDETAMKRRQDAASSGNMGALEKFVTMISRYGAWNIVKAILLFLMFSCVLYLTTNMDKIVERVLTTHTVEQADSHEEAMEIRRRITPQVENILNAVVTTLNGDRAFLLEMHNGSNNTSGLPFLYAEMTYEVALNGYDDIDEDYSSLNLSRFNMAEYLNKKHMWVGSLEELRVIDKKLAARVESSGGTYMGFIIVQGIYNELGFLGVSFCDNKVPPTREEIEDVLIMSAQRLSGLLDLRDAQK